MIRSLVAMVLTAVCVGTGIQQPQPRITYSIADTTLSRDVVNGWVPTTSVSYVQVPRIYRTWWDEISDCAKLHGKFGRIRWWTVVDDAAASDSESMEMFQCPIVGWCNGWSNRFHHIYIAYNRQNNERLIKHEMLHDLLGNKNWWNGQHPPLFAQCHV